MILLNTVPVNIEQTDSLATTERGLDMLKSVPMEELVSTVSNSLVNFAIDIVFAVAVFYIGKFVINKIYKLFSKMLQLRKVEHSLNTFLLSLIRIVLYFILIVSVIGILGIETSSFLALFASAGVAIGMALSGTLQNFAGGVLILLLKPYKVGDFIEAQGFSGTVREIQIFSTIITTADNKSIIIPNGGLSTGSVNNYSRMDYRRVDWSLNIAYGNSIELARKEILQILNADPDIVRSTIDQDRTERNLPKPESNIYNTVAADGAHAPAVVVKELGAAVNVLATAWTRNSMYWDVYFRINETLYQQLPKAGVSFAAPLLNVNINEKPSN